VPALRVRVPVISLKTDYTVKIQKAIVSAFNSSVGLIRSILQSEESPVPKGKSTSFATGPPPGGLRRSIIVNYQPPNELELIWNIDYASYVEEGTIPHRIPKGEGGKILRFWWDKVGKVVFFKSVWHPGTKPQPFKDLAGDIARDFFMDELVANLRAMDIVAYKPKRYGLPVRARA